jgi:hypothetical protein
MDFHVVEKLHGFSTTLHRHAAAASNFGAGFRTIRKEVRTLAALCEEAGLQHIDFLKIDVEGAEADVLAGMDFRRFRPRVVVLEAISPGGLQEASAAWEPDFLAKGYAFAFFDRLNSFYVADEAKALADRFPDEPLAWDRVQHLWDYGRAAERADHPDSKLARILVQGFLAEASLLDPALLERIIQRGIHESGGKEFTPEMAKELIGAAEFPRSPVQVDTLGALLRSDALRAGLGRIGCAYDGGHIME